MIFTRLARLGLATLLSVAAIPVSGARALASDGLPCEDCDEPVVAAGTVLRNGQRLPGALVELIAWPTLAELDALPEGADVKRTVITATRTSSTGSFTLHLNPNYVTRYQEPDGSVNLDVVAYDGDKQVPWSFTTQPNRVVTLGTTRTTWPSMSQSAPDGAANSLTFEVGSNPTVTDAYGPVDIYDHSDADKTLSAPAAVPAASLVAALPGSLPPGCKAGKWFVNNREAFMSVHNWSGAPATVEQAVSKSSSHTLGIAIKVGDGQWKAGGGTATLTLAKDSGAGASMSGIVNRKLFNSVNYREYTCTGVTGITKQRRPKGFYDLFNSPSNELSPVTFTKGCAIKEVGQDFFKDKGKAATFTGGVELGVVNVSSQSGFNAGTRAKFLVKSRVCGNNALGWISASKFSVSNANATPPGGV